MEVQPLHILLADDDEGDRLLFTEAFSELNMKTTVQTVVNGVQLMEWLSRDIVRLPDFIFIDLNMPRKGGIACLCEIRGDERLKNMPVAIYSTSDSEKDREEAFRNGANVYIAKPNNFALLKHVLENAVLAVYAK